MKQKVYTVFWVYIVSWVMKLNKLNKLNELNELYRRNGLHCPSPPSSLFTKGGKGGLLFFVLCSLFITLCGCAAATTSGVKESLEPMGAVITGIDIQDYTVNITVNKPFVYTIYRPGDPYKIVVDLPDVDVGAFNSRIVSDKAGITEIVPSQIKAPSFMARLDMLLPTPSVIVDQEYKNNVLIVKMKEEAPKEAAKEELLPTKEEPLEEIPEVEVPEPAATEQEQLPEATEISGISFEESVEGVKVLIKGNGSMIPNVFPLENRIVIDIPHVVLNTPLPSALISPVKGIRSGKHDDKIRIVLDLKEKTKFDVAATGDSIVIALQGLKKELPVSPIAQMPEEEKEAEVVKEPEMPVQDRCKAYLEGKENINFDFQDQDIVPIFRLFADISGCNLFLHPDVKGRCTMKFKDVPWNQALDTILKTFSLGKSIEGNIIRIAPHTVFAKESEEAEKAREAKIKAEPLATRIFPISYAKVKEIETAMKNSKVLTPKGSISVDERTSTMLINDVASVFPEVENLLATLDKPTPQVLIEARIVEVSTTEVKDLGIQWGVFTKGTNTLASAGGYSNLGTGTFTGENYIVDFPGNAGVGSGSGFTFGILNPAKTMGLDLQLSALEEAGKGKIISNPRIMTVDNTEALISQGESIPYRMQTAEGTVSEGFKDYTLSMKVKPHIAPDNSVALSIEAKKEEPNWTRLSALGTPASTKREANTNVIIKDGETVVIGGILKTSRQESNKGVPVLMNIPILGWLFKSTSATDETSELLIFITPRIVQKQ
jgi:type IV pilus assembly protein PilQ